MIAPVVSHQGQQQPFQMRDAYHIIDILLFREDLKMYQKGE